MSTVDVIIVNTLGGALRHYTDGLVGSLRKEGAAVAVVHVDEPSVAGGSGVAWVRRYLVALRTVRSRARRDGVRVVVTWPVLGHLDRLALRALLGRRTDVSLVLHDPKPLVHARGYGRVARRLAAALGHARAIVHSETAAAALREDCPDLVPETLPHPVVPRPATAPGRRGSARPVVRVLGQYKPDRDLELLAAIGSELRGTHRLEVVGRGWPEIAGWSVTDEFVPEERLDELMATADAVLVPYSRFFQSGIAIRALELGTPAVGPASSSMADLYPDDRFLADGTVSSWCRAISAAAEAEPAAVRALAELADERCRTAWGRWLRSGRAAVS